MTTVVLGGDDAKWTTASQVHGVGSIEACTVMEPRDRPAPGGVDSVDFAAKTVNPPVQALLARASPGGSDSVHFGDASTLQTPAGDLLARPKVGGNATVVLGSDDPQWLRDSQTVGVGSSEAV